MNNKFIILGLAIAFLSIFFIKTIFLIGAAIGLVLFFYGLYLNDSEINKPIPTK